MVRARDPVPRESQEYGRSVSKIAQLELPAWLRDLMLDVLIEGAKHFGYASAPRLHTGHPRCRPRVATYPAGGHFNWHRDSEKCDVLACSVLLTPPADFDGGDLSAKGSASAARRELGSATIFPAHWMHRLSRVTRGTRQALVFWGECEAKSDVLAPMRALRRG